MLNLLNARKAIHKTQQEVADYLGISRQAYSNYEAGKREPDFEILLKLGEYFGCSVDYLLGNKKDPAPKGEVSDEDIKFALFDGAPVQVRPVAPKKCVYASLFSAMYKRIFDYSAFD